MAEEGTPLERILKRDGMRAAFELLSEQLSGSDLTSLLLEVFQRRAERVTPAELMRRYGRDRFVAPTPIPFSAFRAVEEACLGALPESFDTVVLAPLVPLGAHSAMTTVDQNNVISTIRSTEVAADPTNGLALLAAAQRKELLAREPRSSERVRLAAFHRVARAQRFEEDGLSFAHFELLGLVTAGRDVGDLVFERESAEEHLGVMVDALVALGANVRIELTDFAEGKFAPMIDELRAQLAGDRVDVVDRPDRPSGRGYYEGFCFKAFPIFGDVTFEVGDGGLVDWTRGLVESEKERLLISGMGLDRLALARA
jgi:hypothetical protein